MMLNSASPLSRMVPAKVALLVVERRVEQQPAHADDGIHRRADFVAHGRQERALGLIGSLCSRARLLGFLEQPGILDGDHRLIGKRRDEFDLLVGK